MLTGTFLKSIMPGQQIATGITLDARLWREPIRWVAIRGLGQNSYDWAIYYHKIDKSVIEITMEGDKVFSEEVIRDLVPCDDEALNLYRI